MLRKPDYGRLFFYETPAGTEAGSGNPPAATTPPATTHPTATPPSTEGSGPVTFTAEQQAAINKLIGDARKEGRTSAEQAAADAETARQAEATRQADIAKGDFEKVKTDLESERDGFKTERDTLAGKVERYEALTKSRVDAIKGELPAEATEDFPAEADAIDQLEWLDGRQKLLAKLAPATQQNGHPRVPATPPPNAPSKPEARSLISPRAI